MVFSRLAWRLAWPVGAAAAVAAALVQAGADGSFAALVLVPLVAAAAAYATASVRVAGRVAHLGESVAGPGSTGPGSTGPGDPEASAGDELDALARRLRQSEQAMRAEIDALQRLEHYRTEFLGNVSHEIKTPVFAIQGFAETLLDGALDDERVRRLFVEKILRNTTRLHTLTRDLADLARIESGELPMAAAPFSLDRVVAEVFETVQPLADARAVGLALDAPEGLPLVLGDRERIRQVVTNLVANAVAYNRDGGRVTVALRVEGDRVRCVVVDTGIGIAAEHLPRLTERFYRADRSRSREHGGTGLGLAIVKHILTAHHAALSVESTPGEGSRFGFALAQAGVRRLRGTI